MSNCGQNSDSSFFSLALCFRVWEPEESALVVPHDRLPGTLVGLRSAVCEPTGLNPTELSKDRPGASQLKDFFCSTANKCLSVFLYVESTRCGLIYSFLMQYAPLWKQCHHVPDEDTGWTQRKERKNLGWSGRRLTRSWFPADCPRPAETPCRSLLS